MLLRPGQLHPGAVFSPVLRLDGVVIPVLLAVLPAPRVERWFRPDVVSHDIDKIIFPFYLGKWLGQVAFKEIFVFVESRVLPGGMSTPVGDCKIFAELHHLERTRLAVPAGGVSVLMPADIEADGQVTRRRLRHRFGIGRQIVLKRAPPLQMRDGAGVVALEIIGYYPVRCSGRVEMVGEDIETVHAVRQLFPL